MLSSRAADTDKELAAQLDAAYSDRIKDPASGKSTRAFTDYELQALHSRSFDQDTSHLSSSSAQLDRLRKAVAEEVRDKVLGPDLVLISAKDLTQINQDGILEAARKKKVQ